MVIMCLENGKERKKYHTIKENMLNTLALKDEKAPPVN